METPKLTILLLFVVMYTSFLVFTSIHHKYSARKMNINSYNSEPCAGNFSQEMSILKDPNRIRLEKRIRSLDLSRRRPNKMAYMCSLWTKLDHALWEVAGGRCGLESSPELVCPGMLMSLPHLQILGFVVLVILSIIGSFCFISVKEHHYVEWTMSDTNILELIGMPSAEQQLIINNGLDQHTIDTYPKVVLPCPTNYNNDNDNDNDNNNDNICSICLMEYQAEEVLRPLPGCQHIFHAVCIDQWLRLKALCPVCRHSLHPVTQAQFDHK